VCGECVLCVVASPLTGGKARWRRLSQATSIVDRSSGLGEGFWLRRRLRLGLRFDLARGAAWRSGLGSGLGGRSSNLDRLSAGSSDLDRFGSLVGFWLSLARLASRSRVWLSSGDRSRVARQARQLASSIACRLSGVTRRLLPPRGPGLRLRSRNQPPIELYKQTTPDRSGSCSQPPDLPTQDFSLPRRRHFRLPDIRLNPRRRSSIARRLRDHLQVRSLVACVVAWGAPPGRSGAKRGKRQTCVCLVLSHFVRSRSAPTKPSKFCPPAPRRARTKRSAAQQTNIARRSDDRVRRSEPRQRLRSLAKL
jgi:hypothetical protein